MIYGNLIGEIAKKGYSKSEIARSLGINRNTLENKLRCKTPFLKDEFDLIHRSYFKNYTYEYLSQKEECKQSYNG